MAVQGTIDTPHECPWSLTPLGFHSRPAIADNREMIDQTQGPCVEEAPLLRPRVRAGEVVAVYGVSLAAIWATRHAAQGVWWMVPGILIAAGTLPFLARRQSPPAVIRMRTLGPDLRLVTCTCLVLLPLTYLAVQLLLRWGISAPLVQARPSSTLAWVVYQFLYVAVAEEVFFRGYLLTSMLGWRKSPGAYGPTVRRSDSVPGEGKKVRRKEGKKVGGTPVRRSDSTTVQGHDSTTVQQSDGPTVRRSDRASSFLPSYLRTFLPSSASCHAIVLSAACFALAHWVAQGQAGGLLTFLPGLVLGWLYARTGTLLAPILFHGLANVSWQLGMGW